MKIIDADKLHYKQVYIATEKGPRPALVVFAKEIRKMPEIVRCKNCVHRFKDGENIVFNCCELNHNKVQADDWFCADGERRIDDETG